jgi:TPR repeat protein
MEALIIIGALLGLFYLGIQLEYRTRDKNRMSDEKMQLLHKLCNKGDGESCYKIGREYRYTSGGYYEHDQKKALEYFKKACDLKYATGCDYAADIYLDESFRDYNVDEAIKYYKLGMTKDYDYEHILGSPRKLAEIYINIKKDISTGADILSKECDRGDDFVCGNTLGYFGADVQKSTRDKVLDYYMNKHPDKCKKCRFMDKWSS